MQKLYHEALRLAQFQLPSSRIVGLIGDSGVGKSSLINSLLDKPDLARASGSGSACTCAITEYIFHEENTFDVHLEFFTVDELKKQIEELLRAYRDFHSKHGSADYKDDCEDSIGKALEKKAILAAETFKAMFTEKLANRPDVLSSLDFKHAVCTMVEWVSQLLPCTEVFAIRTLLEKPLRSATFVNVIRSLLLLESSELSQTKASEDFRMAEAKYDWPDERATIEDLLERIERDTTDVETLKEELEDYEQDLNLTRDQEQDLRQTQEELRQAERSKQNNEVELLRLITKLRNAKVSDHLLQQYRDNPIAATLRTFCVSNKTYWDYRNKPVATSRVYLITSGIIELRKYCVQIVAQSRLVAVTEYIKDRVPVLLGSIQLWIDAGSAGRTVEMKQKTTMMVSEIQRELDKLVSPISTASLISQDLGTTFDRQVDLPMRLNNGPCLVQILRHRRNLTIAGTENAAGGFRVGLSNLQVNALAPLRTAFIGILMEDTYHAANMEYGTGSDRRRKNLITEGFGSVHLFNDYRKACTTEFQKITIALQNGIDEIIRQQFLLVTADLQVLKNDNAVLEAEQDPAFRDRLIAQLAVAKKEMLKSREAVMK
ncbi:hypothetical protein E8E12_002110 [Didymella heteroderae]|uniref:DUF7605 domain-containing protein n=1 Tax=Didymella heteroderae TaxID=1769908 RepID=A0A9P5BVC6_9PLEO|nr:hypothetical protein E8E12_002110 [Didymella heteroderae]